LSAYLSNPGVSCVLAFYADLKDYRSSPTPPWLRDQLRARFDSIFCLPTGFPTLDRLLKRLHANKVELLMVLEHPEVPLHSWAAKQTNGSENDIRCQVTKRHVSGGTHSDIGRDCRDAFLGLAKTCRKLGIAFWTILAPGSASAAVLPSRSFQTSSAVADSPPDVAAARSFAPNTPGSSKRLKTLPMPLWFELKPGAIFRISDTSAGPQPSHRAISV